MPGKIIKFLFFFSFVLLNSCCKSKRCQCYDQYNVREDDCTPRHFGPYYLGGVKDYLYFKPGSWWVYKNDLSGEIDSVYTVFCDTFVENNIDKDRGWLSLEYTGIGFKWQSDLFNTTYTFMHAKYYAVRNDFSGKLGYRINKEVETPTNAYNSDVFEYPFVKGAGYLFQELIPKFTLNNQIYDSVAVFETWLDRSVQLPKLNFNYTYNVPTKYYWAKGVGLILTEQTLFNEDTQTPFLNKWELQKFNIVK